MIGLSALRRLIVMVVAALLTILSVSLFSAPQALAAPPTYSPACTAIISDWGSGQSTAFSSTYPASDFFPGETVMFNFQTELPAIANMRDNEGPINCSTMGNEIDSFSASNITDSLAISLSDAEGGPSVPPDTMLAVWCLAGTAPPSDNADLSDLTTSISTLNPPFSSAHTSYEITVPSDATTVTPGAVAADSNAKVGYQVDEISPAHPAVVFLEPGDTTAELIVTAPDEETRQTYTVTIKRAAAGLSFSPASGVLPSGDFQSSYYQGIVASGGSGEPYTYSIVGGSLPPDMYLIEFGTGSSSLPGGTIYGVPSAAGTYEFTLRAEDGAGNSAQANCTLVIGAGPQPIVFRQPSGTQLPFSMVKEDYTEDLSATGGRGDLYYDITGGNVPLGLSIDHATGELHGTVDANETPGPFTFTVTASDNLVSRTTSGGSESAEYSVEVKASAVTAADKDIIIKPGSTPVPVT